MTEEKEMPIEREIEFLRSQIKWSNTANKYAEKVLDLTLENNRLEKENFELRNEVNILNTARRGSAPYMFTKERLKGLFRNAYMEGMLRALNGYGHPGFTPANIHTIDNMSILYAEKEVEKLDKEF